MVQHSDDNTKALIASASLGSNDDDTTALIAPASLGSNHVRLFGPSEVRERPFTNWYTTICAQGFTISSHTTKISVPLETIEAIQRLLFEQWPQSRREATARDVLSMTRTLWNPT